MGTERGGWSLPSYWLASLAPISERPRLDASCRADVVIVGGGLSGLWSAYYLRERLPNASVVVLEAEIVGYGASGRNGGWVSSLFPVSWQRIVNDYDKAMAAALSRELVATVREVEAKVGECGIDCDFSRRGSVSLIRNPAQAERAMEEQGTERELGLSTELELLDASGADALLRGSYTLGATYAPHCATVQPARLVRGLAKWLEDHGVVIYENSRVTQVGPTQVSVGTHMISAGQVVVATEGFTAGFDRWRRQLLPLYSMMVVTDPLSDAQYEAMGNPEPGLCFADHRNLVIYGQITHDRRVAFGGRGAPYHLGSKVAAHYDAHGSTREGLRRDLENLFPALAGIRFSSHWGGPLGVARDWYPRVVIEGDGVVRVGGYAGDGVAMTNWVGRTVADVLAGTGDPFLGAKQVLSRHPRAWEPEPLRWLGVNSGLWLTRLVDHREDSGASHELLDMVRTRLIGQS